MEKELREKVKQEQIAIYEEEISKIESALKILKEKYQEGLIDLENKLATANFQKEVFEKLKI